MPGTFEELNAKINRLKREGGVGWDEIGKTYAFDGILEGKDYVPLGNDNGFLKVSSDTPDFHKAEKIDTWYGVATPTTPGISIIEGTAENNELFGAKGYIFMIDSDPAMVVITDTLNSPIPSTGLYFFCGYYPENTTMIVNKLVMSSTIHPISDKYLPAGFGGGGLPVVELSTVVSSNEIVKLTAEENAKMDKATEHGTPIIVSFKMLMGEIPYPFSFLFNMFMGNYSAVISSESALTLSKNGDGWEVSVTAL